MFSSSYQGGSAFEIFSSNGSALPKNWTLQRCKKVYAPEVKGYCTAATAGGKLALAKCDLLQPFLVLQLSVPKGQHLSIEFVIHDLSSNHRRVVISTAISEAKVTALHISLPLPPIAKGSWTNICFDLGSIITDNFPGQTFRSLVALSLSGAFRVRKIFTLRQRPVESSWNPDYDELFQQVAIPAALDFPITIPSNTVVVDMCYDRKEKVAIKDAALIKDHHALAFGRSYSTPTNCVSPATISHPIRNVLTTAHQPITGAPVKTPIPAGGKSSKEPSSKFNAAKATVAHKKPAVVKSKVPVKTKADAAQDAMDIAIICGSPIFELVVEKDSAPLTAHTGNEVVDIDEYYSSDEDVQEKLEFADEASGIAAVMTSEPTVAESTVLIVPEKVAAEEVVAEITSYHAEYEHNSVIGALEDEYQQFLIDSEANDAKVYESLHGVQQSPAEIPVDESLLDEEAEQGFEQSCRVFKTDEVDECELSEPELDIPEERVGVKVNKLAAVEPLLQFTTNHSLTRLPKLKRLPRIAPAAELDKAVTKVEQSESVNIQGWNVSSDEIQPLVSYLDVSSSYNLEMEFEGIYYS